MISYVKANSVNDWLKNEIDNILNTYKNESITKVERYSIVEDSINRNFAGVGIAKFVAGKAWSAADKETKENYIILFKRHLALNIASLMEGYSGQTFTIEDKKNVADDVILIDMEIQDKTNKILITWRIKESKNRFYIIDLLVADISLVVTKRSEFNTMLKKFDYDLRIFNENLSNQNNISYNKLIK